MLDVKMKSILLADFADPIIVGKKAYSVDELEHQNITRNDNRISEVPFGFANEGWEAFKEDLKPGCEIRDFNYPQDWWDRGLGCEGYIALKGEFMLAMFVTKMN